MDKKFIHYREYILIKNCFNVKWQTATQLQVDGKINQSINPPDWQLLDTRMTKHGWKLQENHKHGINKRRYLLLYMPMTLFFISTSKSQHIELHHNCARRTKRAHVRNAAKKQANQAINQTSTHKITSLTIPLIQSRHFEKSHGSVWRFYCVRRWDHIVLDFRLPIHHDAAYGAVLLIPLCPVIIAPDQWERHDGKNKGEFAAPQPLGSYLKTGWWSGRSGVWV